MKECEAIIENVRSENRLSLLVHEAQRVCTFHKIPTPKSFLAVTVDEAVRRAGEIGYPVALKVVSPQIIHKSDFGAVALNVANGREVQTQYERLLSEVRRREPSAMVLGFLVEEMVSPSIEVIVGAIRDEQFGPSVMFGIGGIFAEVYDDVKFRVAPIDNVDALNLIHGLHGSKLLEGVRGKPPPDINSVVKILTGVSCLMMEHAAVRQLDLNPVIVHQSGACAVDSRIIIGRS
jgi:acyl-CoA synthetase (NDP forming)